MGVRTSTLLFWFLCLIMRFLVLVFVQHLRSTRSEPRPGSIGHLSDGPKEVGELFTGNEPEPEEAP